MSIVEVIIGVILVIVVYIVGLYFFLRVAKAAKESDKRERDKRE